MRTPSIVSNSVKVGVSVLALAVSVSIPAQAQHLNYLSATAQETAVHKDNLSLATETDVGQAIQKRFIDKSISEEFEPQFGSDVAMVARAAYAQRVFEPIWTRKGANSLKKAYAELNVFGIDDEKLRFVQISDLIERRFNGKSPSVQAQADIDLTAAWFALATRVGGDLSAEGEARVTSDSTPARPLLVESLTEAGQGQAQKTIQDFEPDHPQYEQLKLELVRYQQIAAKGGWKAIPEADDSLEPGQQDLRIPAIRERLEAEGYYSGPSLFDAVTKFARITFSESNTDANANEIEDWLVTYDEGLEKALKSFQSHHGLAVDGVIGPKTLKALNESAESKVRRIRATMDQWRDQRDISGRYVWANIPSYTAEGWANGKREIAMKTIVGLPSRKTPTFSDEIEYVVANPRWYAPTSIVAKDKLPKLQRDPSYAARNGYSIYDRSTGDRVSAENVNWSDPSSAQQYQFVQAAGAGNALGELKIIFPNQHAVYLHGTPSEYLFDREERAFSSGCVRLEHPVEMAEWIAGGSNSARGIEIAEAVESGRNSKITFDETTSVHLTYMTVTVDDSGRANFWRDIYNRDSEISQTQQFAELYTPFEERVSEGGDEVRTAAVENAVSVATVR